VSDGLDFRVAVLALDRDCIAARDDSECEGVLHAHHAISQQQLRRYGLGDYARDPRVGAAVCERHHRRHHNRREPLQRAMLPRRVLNFVAEFNLAHLLERYYE
jgi:hypothetical protein